MNSLYKGLIVATVSTAMLTMAGCTPNEDVSAESEVTAPIEQTESEKTAEAITAANITDEQLAEMTGFEADFKSYLEKGPSRIVFLKEQEGEMKITSTLLIYSGSGEDSTALYLYEKDGSIVDAKLDEFVGSVSTEGFEFDFMFYSFGNMMEKQPTEEGLGYTSEEREAFETELKETYEGQPLYKLHEKLGVYVPVYRYEKAESDLKLNTYTIVSEVGYTASTDVNVVYDSEGAIKLLYLDDSYGPGKVDPLGMLAEQE